MRNRKDKIFALIAAGCLCLSGLTGCGEIKMSPDNISSKSDDGLMGSVKERQIQVTNPKQMLPVRRIR